MIINIFQPRKIGSSVLAVKYDKGVMIAADTLASYGSLARYKDIKRIIKVGERTIMGASGTFFPLLPCLNSLIQHISNTKVK